MARTQRDLYDEEALRRKQAVILPSLLMQTTKKIYFLIACDITSVSGASALLGLRSTPPSSPEEFYHRVGEKTDGLRKNNYPSLLKRVRNQLGFSQEDLARKLGVSYVTVNRWENGQVKPSKLAKAQLDSFCTQMVQEGKLRLSSGWM